MLILNVSCLVPCSRNWLLTLRWAISLIWKNQFFNCVFPPLPFLSFLDAPQSKLSATVALQPLCHRVQLGPHVRLWRRLCVCVSGRCLQVNISTCIWCYIYIDASVQSDLQEVHTTIYRWWSVRLDHLDMEGGAVSASVLVSFDIWFLLCSVCELTCSLHEVFMRYLLLIHFQELQIITWF